MKTRLKTKALARVAGAALLLSTALTAWGVSIILTGDAGGTVSCTTSLVTVTDGNVTATVPTDCIPTGGGGGGGGGTGPYTLSVVKSGPNAASGTVTGADGAINCGTTCSASLASATPVSLTATPGTGTFAGWSGGGCIGTGTCAFSISADTTVTAVFGPLNLTVATAGTGAGTVTSGTIIHCDSATHADCSESFNTVTSVTLTATPDGATFAGWSGGGCGGTAPTCTVNMNDSKAVTATFNAAGACGPLPTDVTVVDTGTMGSAFAKVTLSPLPRAIIAFKVTTPSVIASTGFTATRNSGATATKSLVVSTCPGVLTPVDNQTKGCIKQYYTDSATAYLTNDPSAGSSYCKLSNNTVYYVNAVSKTLLSDSGYNCTNTTNCSFFGSRSAR